MHPMTPLRSFAALLATLALVGTVHAQTYPSRPVRMIAPYASGGSSSAGAQALSQKYQEVTGQPLVVDYRPGAASNIGSDMVAKAAPDGYTVLMGTTSLAINPSLYRVMTFNPIKDLAPVAILFRAPNVLAVNPALPVRTVKELIDYARANPGKLNYASSGTGATNHMGMELLKHMANLDIVHVPFKGSGETLPALIGNQVQLMFSPASSLKAAAQANRIRLIAVSGATRDEALNLPPIGATLTGFESDVWFGLFVPAGTPAAIVTKLNADINTALKDAKVRSVLEGAGQTVGGGAPEDMRKLLAVDSERWATVVKATGIKAD